MGLEAEKDDAAARLVEAGRAMLARGDNRFPLTRLCAEAGVSLADFRNSFASKTALLHQLMQTAKPEPAAADPWLERRLRVFERALNTLEERAEKNHREQRLIIARLEERLAAMGAATPEAAETQPAPEPDVEDTSEVSASGNDEDERAAQDLSGPEKPAPIFLAPLESAVPAKAAAGFLEPARRAALEFGRELEKPRPARRSWRWFAVAGLAALVLLVCAGLTLVHAARAPRSGEGVSHRQVAHAPLARLMARADSGDAAAETVLAFAYLRGQGVVRDDLAAARWSRQAAAQGDPRAQYLIGSLVLSGTGTARDPAQAFAWFRRAAAAGQLKAMHNLAIAYAEGQGTAKNEAAAATWFARAAARGYVDSAFDLAVLYERGAGVPQSVAAALHWYGVAARAGDAVAARRAQVLKAETNSS